MNETLVVLISLFLVAAGALGSWYYLSQKKIPTPPEPTPAIAWMS